MNSILPSSIFRLLGERDLLSLSLEDAPSSSDLFYFSEINLLNTMVMIILRWIVFIGYQKAPQQKNQVLNQL